MRDKIHRMFLEVWHRYELRDGVPVLCQPELPPPPPSKLMRGVEPKALTPAEQKRNSLNGGAGGASMPADKPGALAAFDNVDDLAPKAQEADPMAAYFWYSPNTDVSLWVDPWDMVRFDVCEIDKDVFVDGARGLPDNCGATKVSLRLVAAGATVGVEHSGVCDALCGNQPLVWGVPTKLQNSLARSHRSRFG